MTTHEQAFNVLYRVVSKDGRYDVMMRDDQGFWSCVNSGLTTFDRAAKIAAKYRSQEAIE